MMGAGRECAIDDFRVQNWGIKEEGKARGSRRGGDQIWSGGREDLGVGIRVCPGGSGLCSNTCESPPPIV